MVFPLSTCTSVSSAGKSSKRERTGHSEEKSRKKPLLNKRLYLDIKNHAVASKLESSLKALGAIIEVFLVREVNYIITDRPDKIETGFSPLLESPSTDSPTELQERKKFTKSRAEAMLERVRSLPQQTSCDPLDNAIRWGITVWPLEKVLKWLQKISVSVKKTTPVVCQSRLLKQSYVKIETLDKKYQPIYKEFDSWPVLSLDSVPGASPFIPKQIKSLPGKDSTPQNDVSKSKGKPVLPKELKMTQKVHASNNNTNTTKNSVQQHSGFCEICHVQYTNQQEHILSDIHLKFVKNDGNFSGLDMLINKHADVGSFLKMNGVSDFDPCLMPGCSTRRSRRSVVKCHSLDADISYAVSQNARNGIMRQTLDERHLSKAVAQNGPLEVHCNGIQSQGYDTRYGSRMSISVRHNSDDSYTRRRVRSSSATYYSAEPVLSPTGSDSGHKLRARETLWLPKSLLGTTAEDDSIHGRSKPTYSTDPSNSTVCKYSREKSEEAPIKLKIKCHKTNDKASYNCIPIRKKRPSAEEKLLEDNKAYYKLELKNSKLRSSRFYLAQRESQFVSEERFIEENSSSSGHTGSEENASIVNGEGLVNVNKLNFQKMFNDVNNLNPDLLSIINSNESSLESISNHKPSTERTCDKSNTDKVNSTNHKVNFNKTVKIYDDSGCEKKKQCVFGNTGKTFEVKFSKVSLERKVRLGRKRRRSELSVLSVEAEAFMFGETAATDYTTTYQRGERVNNSETGVTQSDDAETGTPSVEDCDSSKDLKIKIKNRPKKRPRTCVDQDDESCIKTCVTSAMSLFDQYSSSQNQKGKKKRRTHAELFIHDNLDYYKFEIANSRLRHQNTASSFLDSDLFARRVSNRKHSTPHYTERFSASQMKQEVDDDDDDDDDDEDDKPLSTITKVSVKKIVQKGIGKGFVESKNGNHSISPEIMKDPLVESPFSSLRNIHFSFESLPTSQPWYKTYHRQDKGKEYKFIHYEPKSWKTFILPYEMPKKVPVSHSPVSIKRPLPKKTPKRTKKKRKGRFTHLVEDKPRKSPRCHASTLAILSGIIHHRRHRKTSVKPEGNCVGQVNSEDSSLDCQVPESSCTALEKTEAEDFQDLPQSLDDILNVKDDIINNMKLDGLCKSDSEISVQVGKTSSCKFKNSIKRKKSVHPSRLNSVRKCNVTSISKNFTNNSESDSPVIVRAKSDAIDLINTFSECQCSHRTTQNMVFLHGDLNVSHYESCNVSEYSVSSGGDIPIISNLLENKAKPGTKKRKRKINLTGWPVEKKRKRCKESEDAKRKSLSPIKDMLPDKEDSVSVISSVAESCDDGVTGALAAYPPSSIITRNQLVKPTQYLPCVRVKKLIDVASMVRSSQKPKLRSASCASMKISKTVTKIQRNGIVTKTTTAQKSCKVLEWDTCSATGK